MKKSSIIINTSRGPIINEKDLINSIKNFYISGVGLDVYDIEPLPKNHELRSLSKDYNVVLSHTLGMCLLKPTKNFIKDTLMQLEPILMVIL